MCISAIRLDNMEKYGLKLDTAEKGGLRIMGTEILSPIIKKILFDGILEKVENHGPSAHLQQMMTNLSLHMMGPIAAQERNIAALKLETANLAAETERVKTLNDAKRTDWLQKTSILMCEKTREINRLNSIVKSVQGDEHNGDGDDDGHGSDADRGNDDDDDSDDNRQQHMPLPARNRQSHDRQLHPPKATVAISSQGNQKGTTSKTSSSSSSSSSSSNIGRSTSITSGPLESSRTAAATAAGSTTLTQDISFLDLPSGTQEISAADLLTETMSKQRLYSQSQHIQEQPTAKGSASSASATAGSSSSSGAAAAAIGGSSTTKTKKKRKGLFDSSDDDSDAEKH